MSQLGTNIDTAVNAKRLSTPAAAYEQRAVPRYSIAELNASDFEDVRDRLLAHRRDERSPVQKVLDLVDLPRNLVANAAFRVAAPSAVGEARQKGEYGALGIPTVTFSDALKSMGVENRVVRGVVGFAGDVLMDPLTYVPGGQIKQVGKVALTGGGARVLKGAAKQAGKGGLQAVRNPLARDLIESSGLTAQRLAKVNELSAAGKLRPDAARELVSRRTLPRVRPVTTEGVSRVVRDIKPRPSILEKSLLTVTDETPERLARQIASAKAYVKKYGHGAGLLKIGGVVGTQVLNVPFTDYGVSVPAFTSTGRAARAQLQAVRDTRLGVARLKIAPPIAEAHAGLTEGRNIADEIGRASDEFRTRSAELSDRITAGDTIAPAELDAVRASHAQAVEGLIERSRAAEERVAAAVKAMGSHQWGSEAQRASTYGTLGQMLDEAKSSHRKLVADAGLAREAVKIRNRAVGDINEAVARKAAANPGVDINDIRKIETEGYLKNLDEKMFERVDTDPLGAEALADALHTAQLANQDYAKTLNGAIDSLNTASGNQFAELARMATGSDDRMTGHALTSPFRIMAETAGIAKNAAVDNALGMVETLDRGIRGVFGRRSGHVPRQVAALKRQISQTGYTDTVSRVAGRMGGQIETLAKTHGLNHRGLEEVRALHAMATIRALQMLAEQSGRPLEMAFKTVKDGQLVDGALITTLNDLKTKGSLSGVKPEFFDDFDNAVRGWLDELRQLTDAEMKDGLLGGTIDGYLPNTLTESAQQALRTVRKTPHFEGGSVAQKAASEPFEKRRSTWVYQFQNPESGQWEQFYEADRWVAGLSDDELRRIRLDDAPLADGIEQMRQSIDRYDTMIGAPPPRPADPFQLNEEFRNGRFETLTGGSRDVDELFDTSLPMMLAKRTAQHERAAAKANLNELIGRHFIPVSAELVNTGLRTGEEITLPNGMRVQKIGAVKTPTGENAMAFRMNGKNYRQLSPSTIGDKDGPLTDLLGQDPANGFVDEILADKIDMIAAMTKPGSGGLDSILAAANKITSVFKVQALFHPSWMASNIVGDATLAAQGGANPAKMAQYAPVLIQARKHANDPERLAKLRLNIGGQTLDGNALSRLMREHNAWNNNAGVETIFQALSRGMLSLPSHFYKTGALSGIKPDLLHAMKNWGVGSGMVQRATGLAQGVPTVVTDRLMRRVIGPWFRANAFTSDVMRGAALLSHMDQGNDAAAAAQKMTRSMFDYADFTRVEEKYFRTLIPFYSWIRNNLAFQMTQVLAKPYQAAMIPKVATAVEEMLAGEERVPRNLRPRWMQDAMALQIGGEPEGRFSILLSNTIPVADVFNVLQGVAGGPEGVREALHYFGSSTNPFIQSLVSLSTGQEYFSGREIGYDGVSGDMQVGEFLGRQLRPVSELGVGLVEGKIPQAFERSTAEGVGRSLLGGRIQGFGQERLQSSRLADYKREEEALRRAIRRAEREGDQTASVEARVRLLGMYRAMAQSGLADEIPKWAGSQLEAVQ